MTPEQRASAVLRFLTERGDPLSGGDGEGWASAGDISAAVGAGVDRTTVYRDLQRLTDERVLEQKGPTRSRVYRLDRRSEPFLVWELSQPPESRRRVGYTAALLLGYEPNKSAWLKAAQRKALHELALPKFEVTPEVYRRVMNSLLIDLSFASSRLEDVHISWLDTKSLVELGERPGGLTDREYRIVMNHKAAIEFICDHRLDLDLSERNVRDVHKLLSSGLLGNPDDEGRLRRSLVYFQESAYRPIENPFVLEEQFKLFCDKAREIKDPFERSFFTMAMVPYLQPFIDANKRTSRLCMNVPLLHASLAPFSFAQIDRRAYMFGLMAFYERGRPEFLAKVFVDTYARSAPKYTELMGVVHEGGIISTLSMEPLRAPPPAKRFRPKP